MRTFTFNTIATDNKLAKALVENRAYASEKLGSDILTKEELITWKGLVDRLHSAAYTTYSKCFNNSVDGLHFQSELNNVDKTVIYEALRSIFAHIGEVNGMRLVATESSAQVVLGFCAKVANGYSPEMSYQKSKRSNAVKLLAQYEATNGVPESSKEAIKADIEAIDITIAALREKPGNVYKTFTKASANVFRKSIEDYLADLCEHRLMMTEEEVQAEAEARRAARRAKTAAKKAAKKQEVPSENIETQAVVNA